MGATSSHWWLKSPNSEKAYAKVRFQLPISGIMGNSLKGRAACIHFLLGSATQPSLRVQDFVVADTDWPVPHSN